MELTNGISFSNELKGNETCKITYSGMLFQNNSDAVTIVFGFGQNWDYTTEQIMEKTESGFTAEIQIRDSFDTFNFCFRNSNYEWDNNNYGNYISSILPASLPLEIEDINSQNTNNTIDITEIEVLDKQETTEQIQETTTDIIDELLKQFFEDTPSNEINQEENQNALETLFSSDTNDTNSIQENEVILNNNDTTTEPDFCMDKLIEELLVPIINESNIEENEKTTNIDYFETDEELEFPIELSTEEDLDFDTNDDIEHQLLELKNENELEESIKDLSQDIYEPSLLEDIKFAECNIPQINEKSTQNFELAKQTIEDTNIQSVESTENDKNNETTTSLVKTQDDEFKMIVSPRKLRKFYMIRKKIKLALYKAIVVIPKLLTGEFGSSKD